MKRNFLDELVKRRFQSKDAIRKVIDASSKEERQSTLPKYFRGVRNGVYYRIRVPPERQAFPSLPKLASPTSPPKSFQRVPQPQQVKTTSESGRDRFEDYLRRLRNWWKENWNVMLLNAGSVCTLIGFTRSDVLELRVLSATGSTCSMIYSYFLNPPKYPPMVWSGCFALVNIYKIVQILRERKGNVALTQEQEDVYVKFFLPHGITPKQFEAIDARATKLRFPSEVPIVKQGEKLEHIYLVVEGHTRANILGRHLTAASFRPASKQSQGGASGAWIGEMAFLEWYWLKEQGKHREEERKKRDTSAVANGKNGADAEERASDLPQLKSEKALYTIITKDECTVLKWSQKDMELLMGKSTDMRAALTRAMTAAIVGKVINFTVSRSSGVPTWSSWLDDWRHAAGAKVEVASAVQQQLELESEEDDGNVPAESTRSMPVKKFG